MHKVLHVRSSIGRKKEYRITTSVEERGGVLKVIKKASYPEATEFLNTFLKKNSGLAAAINKVNGFTVSHMEKEGDEVCVDYINGMTLDEEFSLALQQRDTDKLIALFGEVIGLIDKLKTLNSKVDKQAHPIFGDFGAGDKKIELLDCGYIDFNLDNFIRGSDGLYVIDPEFKYEFGVPKQYVLNRLVVSYMTRYSHLASAMANEKFPVIQLADQLFIPKRLWDSYKNRFNELQDSLTTEEKFQQFYSYTGTASAKIYSSDQRITHTSPVYKDASVQLEDLRAHVTAQQAQLDNTLNELERTKLVLSNYRNFLPIRIMRRIKRIVR